MKHVIPTSLPLVQEPMKSQFESFFEHEIDVRHISPNTTNCSFNICVRFGIWLNENEIVDLYEVKSNDYLDFIAAQKWKKPTTKKNRAYLKMLLNYQAARGMVEATELIRYDSVKVSGKGYVKARPKAFTDDELNQIFRRIDQRYHYDTYTVDKARRGKQVDILKLSKSIMNVQMKTLCWVLLEMGLRIDEAWRMTIDDVDTTRDHTNVVGKFGKTRFVPYSDELKTHIKKWAAHRELIVGDHKYLWISCFKRERGEHISYRGLVRWIHVFTGVNYYQGKTEKDMDANWHKFRKTFATRCYQSGMDILVLSRLLGHSDIKVTMIYLGIDQKKDLDEAKRVESIRKEIYAKAFT